MCDTIGLVTPSKALFAKNSDRSPNEPQVNQFFPAADHAKGTTIKATYISISQAEHTHALLLSRPTWMWGGEMGVNEHGVCIGNEAVFTKGKYAKTGLTGMDLLRLGLERGSTAQEARDVIINLLEEYGQGGNCGFDHNFYYDNAYLIMDRKDLYILETSARNWVYKRVDRGSISNRLTIGTEGDAYSGGKTIDFKKKHFEPLYSHFSGSANRLSQTGACLSTAKNTKDLMNALRSHREDVRHPLTQASVASACMHAGGLVGDHTTASIIVELDDDMKIWLTGSSTPCISLFKPWLYGNVPVTPVFADGDPAAEAYWFQREAFHRQAIGHVLPSEFYEERDALENEWINAVEDLDRDAFSDLSKRAMEEETAFYSRWASSLNTPPQGKQAFLKYWQKKNEAVGTPHNTL